MARFDPRILAKTVKTISSKKERVTEAQVRGTVVSSGGEHYIQLDGAAQGSLTPVANAEEGSSESAFVDGDRVLVLIKNHQAIVTKNLTTGLQVQTAKEALVKADIAKTAADEAREAASTAKEQARIATKSANASLSQLGVVEDVVGALNWVTTHATYKATSDNEVVEGKWYFTKSGNTYNVVINPSGNPSVNGWYEIDTIDEAVSNYVASHLALTNQGLWVVNDNNSYKILLASDGMKVYDSDGNLVSTFGENIIFDADHKQYIGNNNAFIVFDPTGNNGQGSLIIGGSSIQMGNRTLDEVINTVNTTANEAKSVANNALGIGNNALEEAKEAKKSATSYITKISNDGIFVHQTDAEKDGDIPTQSTAYGVHISDEIDIIKGGVSVATYGTNTRIGKETEGNVLIDNDSVDIRNGQNVKASFGEKAVIGPLKDHARLEILRNETTDPGTYLQMKAINSANQVFGDIYFIADSVNAIPSYFRVKPVDGVGRDAAITMRPGSDPTVSVYENLDAASIKRRVWFNNREYSTTVSPIGTVKTDSVTSASIACSSEYKTITAVKLRLDAGVWLVVGSLVFSKGTGQRIIRLVTSADSDFTSVTVHTDLSTREGASSVGTTKPIAMAIINVTNEESAQSLTDLFVACQGYSSTSCTISAVYLQAVKIF